eukprot:gene2127-2321_t
MDEIGPVELLYLDPKSLQEGLTYSKLKRRENKEENEARSHRHEQRRRKFIRQQDTLQEKQAQEYFNLEVVGQLLQKSQSEKKTDEEEKIVLGYKKLIPTNRRQREQQIVLLEEMDQNFEGSWRRTEANREFRWVIYLDTTSQTSRRNRLLDANKLANRSEATNFVSSFLEEVIDSVIWMITCREIGSFDFAPSDKVVEGGVDMSIQLQHQNAVTSTADVIPTAILQDLKEILTSPLPFPPPLPNLKPMLVSSALVPFNISERPKMAEKDWLLKQLFTGKFIYGDDTKEMTNRSSEQYYAEYLSKQDMLNYLQSLSEAGSALDSSRRPNIDPDLAWRSKDELVIEYSGKVRGEKDALVTPSWLIRQRPCHLLGDIIVQLRCTLEPIPPLPSPQVPTQHIPFKVALFGVSELRRKEAVEAFRQAIPRLEIISVEAMVRHLINSFSASNQSNEKTLDEEEEVLARSLCNCLACGQAVPDQLYLNLILRRIRAMPLENNGFLLVDYPNTLEQLLLLMEAFSGIRFDHHKPQAADRLSPFAPLLIHKEAYDMSHCGLDLLFYLDPLENSALSAMQKRLTMREDLVKGETMFLDEEVHHSVRYLKKVYDPSHPFHALGLEATAAEKHSEQIRAFGMTNGILEAVGESQALSEAASSLARRFLPEERLTEQFWIKHDEEVAAAKQAAKKAEELAKAAAESETQQEVVCEELLQQAIGEESATIAGEALAEETAAALPPQDGTVSAPGQTPAPPAVSAPSNPPVEEPALPRPQPPPFFMVNAILPKLAAALHGLWREAEDQSLQNGQTFFQALRDVRFQMIQRRRMAIDTVNCCMIRLDDRQELFNNFRNGFNAIEEEMRYDPDCIAELHLRTLQLRNDLTKLCDQRKKEMEEAIEVIQKDNNVKVLQHRCYCEAAFFLQSEYSRFYTILQIIMDFAKATQGFEIHERVRNELEPCLPITLEGYKAPIPPVKPSMAPTGKDAKNKEKKPAKDAPPPFAPYRELLPPWFVPGDVMIQQIPSTRANEAEGNEGKAKSKGKDKKGVVDDPNQTPLDILIGQLLNDLTKWKKANGFVLNRELHDQDEQLCQAVESAVWYEAERMEQAVQMVRDRVTQQVSWLEQCEADFMRLLQALSHDRYVKELVAGEKVIDLIEACIANAEPLDMVWLVSPDASTPVVPGSFWKKWRYLVPFIWLKQYEKGLKKKFRKLINLHKGEISSAAAEMNAEKLAALAALASGPGGADDDDDEEDDDEISQAPQQSSRNNRTAPHKLNSGKSVPRNIKSAGKGSAPPSRRPSSSSAAMRRGSPGSQKLHSARRGSTEAHIQRLRSPTINSGSPTSSRPPSGEIDVLAREQERYSQQRQALEEKLLQRREARELEFRHLGMSPSAAKLAAFNELLLEEQHQLADLEAQWKPILQRTRPRSSIRATSAHRRPTTHS